MESGIVLRWLYAQLLKLNTDDADWTDKHG
jgi:hypothetical protein